MTLRQFEKLGIPLSMDTLTTPAQVHALMKVSADMQKAMMKSLESRYGIELIEAQGQWHGLYDRYISLYRKELKIVAEMGLIDKNEMLETLNRLPEPIYRELELIDGEYLRCGDPGGYGQNAMAEVAMLQDQNKERGKIFFTEKYDQIRAALGRMGFSTAPRPTGTGDKFYLSANNYAEVVCQPGRHFEAWRAEMEGETVRHQAVMLEDRLGARSYSSLDGNFDLTNFTAPIDRSRILDEPVSIMELEAWRREMVDVVEGRKNMDDVAPSFAVRRDEINARIALANEVTDQFKGIREQALAHLEKEAQKCTLDVSRLDSDWAVKLLVPAKERVKFKDYLLRIEREIKLMELFVPWAANTFGDNDSDSDIKRLRDFHKKMKALEFRRTNLITARGILLKMLRKHDAPAWVENVLIKEKEVSLISDLPTDGPFTLYLSSPPQLPQRRSFLGLRAPRIFTRNEKSKPQYLFAMPSRNPFTVVEEAILIAEDVETLDDLFDYVQAREQTLAKGLNGGALSLKPEQTGGELKLAETGLALAEDNS